MNPISMDLNLAKKLDQGMRLSDTVELPFPVAYIWALNGQASLKSQGGALYYGGWACKVEEVEAVAEQQGLSIPQEWKQATISTRDGDEYEAFTSRHVIVAPIGKRESWLLDGQRFANYVDGARRHLQVLSYLAEAVGENGNREYIPWGPVVLTAKGYQARNLLDAFTNWEKATAPARRVVAPGVPAWCFYLALGTFERERYSINVGQPGRQSPITPISAYIPEKITEELVSSLFVGNEVATAMADLQDQASDWLKAWREASLEGDAYPDGGLHIEDEIPF